MIRHHWYSTGRNEVRLRKRRRPLDRQRRAGAAEYGSRIGDHVTRRDRSADPASSEASSPIADQSSDSPPSGEQRQQSIAEQAGERHRDPQVLRRR